MSDTEEALSLTNTDKWYAKTALDRLAETYDAEGKAPNASAVRSLAVRIEAHRTDRRPYNAEDVMRWQQRMAQCQGDHERTKGVMREWWVELCTVATDPAGTLADAVFPIVDQSVKEGVHQLIGNVLATLESKMTAVVGDPAVFEDPAVGANKALDLILEFVKAGRQQHASHQPLWSDDPHLAALARQMQAQAQAQAQQGAPVPP